MISNIGPGQLVIILLIVVMLFGAKRIPEIAKGLGRGIRDFKGALKHDEDPAEPGRPAQKSGGDVEKPTTSA